VTDYTSEFFEVQGSGSRSSAETIVPICMRLLRPRSVVDVGCGIGTWLKVFNSHGVAETLGLDGDYVDRALLQIPSAAFRSADLESRISVDRRFDLAVSLEVAEHLTPARGPTFVADLVALAPAVLFSAAIPRQGGTSHRNERWQSYWASAFREHGYSASDCIRPVVWEDSSVDRWYVQNTILYTDSSVELNHVPSELPLSLVHPEVYLAPLDPSKLRLHELMVQILPAVQRSIRARVRDTPVGQAIVRRRRVRNRGRT
jgi:hypothetical protein